MPSVMVTTALPPAPPRRWVRLISENGAIFTFPHAPTSTPNRGLAMEWEPVNRPGQLPLVEFARSGLRVISMRFLLGLPDNRSIEPELRALQLIARTRARCRMEYGPLEDGWWRVTDYGYDPQRRRAVTHEISQAVVDLEFTRASEAVVNVGPLTGGAITPPAAPIGPRSITVAEGDTLFKLAQRHLGDGNRWRELADANGVTDVRNLRVGQQLTIPSR